MSTRLRFRASIVVVAFAVVASLTGCGPDATLKLARQAERRGDVHKAYDFYCKMAAEFPDQAEAGDAIARLGPTAAVYWYSRARIAWSEGRTADAWRSAMRALEIRPDHVDAVALVRRLEINYAGEVALARYNWQRKGTSALTETGHSTTNTDKPSPASESDSSGVALASAGTAPEITDTAHEEPADARADSTSVASMLVSDETETIVVDNSRPTRDRPEVVIAGAATGAFAESDLRTAARPDATVLSAQTGGSPVADFDEAEIAALLAPRFPAIFIAGVCSVALLGGLGIYRSFLNRTPRQKTATAVRS